MTIDIQCTTIFIVNWRQTKILCPTGSTKPSMPLNIALNVFDIEFGWRIGHKHRCADKMWRFDWILTQFHETDEHHHHHYYIGTTIQLVVRHSTWPPSDHIPLKTAKLQHVCKCTAVNVISNDKVSGKFFVNKLRFNCRFSRFLMVDSFSTPKFIEWKIYR